MRGRMIEVFFFGAAVLFPGRWVVTHLSYLSSLYNHIQIDIQIDIQTGIQTMVGNETQIEF